MVIPESSDEETFAETIGRWSSAVPIESLDLGAPDIAEPLPERDRLALFRSFPAVQNPDAADLTPEDAGYAV